VTWTTRPTRRIDYNRDVPCIDDNCAGAFVEGRLPPDAAGTVEAHIDRCAACRLLVAELTKLMTGPDPAHAGAELPLGATIGRYRIVERLGAGAMGVVYRARDPELERDVALKLWSSASAGDTRENDKKGVLRREAKALARVCDPHVVRVYDAATHGDEVYIAMELVEGTTLHHWARGRSWREIVRAFVDAGRGLEAIHAAGLVHRDFKPHNVLVGRDGRVRVADFGLASTAATGTSAAGTPQYMAPEQRDGRYDARSDQYSYCTAFAEALRGATVPAALRAALARGCADEPAARHASMTDALAAIRRAVAEPRRRWPWIAGAAAAAAVAVAVIGVRGRAAEPTASVAAQLYVARAIALASSHDGAGAVAAAREAATLARAAGDRATEAEALYHVATSDDDTPVAAREDALLASVRAAEAGGHDILAARSWTMLSLLTAFAKQNRTEGARWAAHAAASLERAGGDAAQAFQLATVEAMTSISNGDFMLAGAQAAATLQLARASFGEQHASTARAYNLVGFVAAVRGDRAAAAIQFRRAVALGEALADDELPQYLTNLGEMLRDAEGMRVLERALQLQEAARGPRDPYLATIHRTLAEVQRERGLLVAARGSAERAKQLATASGDDDEVERADEVLAELSHTR
jgi:predicted Ser/Thr protein kinase